MIRLPSVLLFTAFVVLSTASSTRAQSTAPALPPNVSLDVDGEPRGDGTDLFVTAADCERNATFDLRFSNLTQQTWEAWVTSDGADCSLPENRSSKTKAPAHCWLVISTTPVTTSANLLLDARRLFSRDGAMCDRASGVIYALYFFPLDAPTDTSPNKPPAARGTPSVIRFQVYSARPGEPVSAMAQTVGSNVTISWQAPASATNTTLYRLYYAPASDPGQAEDGGTGCASALSAGALPPQGAKFIELTGLVTTQPRAAFGAASGQDAAVAVATLDAAGNTSVLSNVMCLTTAKKHGGSGCNVAHQRHAPWASITGFVAIGLLAGRRRRRPATKSSRA